MKAVCYVKSHFQYILKFFEIYIKQGNLTFDIFSQFPLLKHGYCAKSTMNTIVTIYNMYNPNDISNFYDNTRKSLMAFYYNIDSCLDNGIILFNDDLNEKLKDNLSIMDRLNIEQKNMEIIFRNKYLFSEKDLDNSVELYSVMKNYNGILKILPRQSCFRFYMIIICKDYLNTERILKNDIVDPRGDRNEAYHLSLKMGNDDVSQMIKNKTIYLNWLNRQALINYLNDDIINYCLELITYLF
jgi:hypothetical protein